MKRLVLAAAWLVLASQAPAQISTAYAQVLTATSQPVMARDGPDAANFRGSLVFLNYCVTCHGPMADGKGRAAAMEIMLVTPRIQALIRRGELETIRQAIEEGNNEGLQTFDQALLDLFQRKIIGQEDAVRFADSPNNLRLRLKGIR